MSEIIQTRFTPSKFDTAKSVSVAEGMRLTARIHCSVVPTKPNWSGNPAGSEQRKS